MLYCKNPIKAPATVAEMIAKSVLPNDNAIIAQATNAGIPQPAANPSKPSVGLYAFDAPVIMNTANIG